MKLHSEISVGWLILYVAILVSLRGENSDQRDSKKFDIKSAHKKNSVTHNYILMDKLKTHQSNSVRLDSTKNNGFPNNSEVAIRY